MGNDPVAGVDPMGLQFGYHQGNWFGMGWSNGTKLGENNPGMPMFPGDIGPNGESFKSPTSQLDLCGYQHDLCMHAGHSIANNNARKCWNGKCHKDLAHCLEVAGHPILAKIFEALSKFPNEGTFNPDPRLLDPYNQYFRGFPGYLLEPIPMLQY